ncbi:MAG: nitrate reductase cytochrome c-type subunit [Magnetococcales bacterium]|nr:nitrate reductase cytochrome c-type subunit [Magnetococcales bacterium]
MKKIALFLFLAVTWMAVGTIASPALAQEIKSLRNAVPLDQEPTPPDFKKWQQDQHPLPRDFVQQPPLIPHTIEGYTIDIRQNKCLTCHSWTMYKETGATKVSLTHFRDRMGTELSDISPQRYFCVACHAPQRDAQPLVGNTFQPVRSVKGK